MRYIVNVKVSNIKITVVNNANGSRKYQAI